MWWKFRSQETMWEASRAQSNWSRKLGFLKEPMNAVRIYSKFSNKNVWRRNKERLKNKKKNLNLMNYRRKKELWIVLLQPGLPLEIHNQVNKRTIPKTKMFQVLAFHPFSHQRPLIKNLKPRNNWKNRNYWRMNKEKKKFKSTCKNKSGKDRSVKRESKLSFRDISHI